MDARLSRREIEDSSSLWDVLVIGGGNAGLCAAITARESGASVLILDCAPRDFRGGNSRHTRNLRYAHPRADGIMTGPYLTEFINRTMVLGDEIAALYLT